MRHRRKEKKDLLGFLAPLLLFAAGAGIFLYPAASNLLAESRQADTIRAYRAEVAEEDGLEVELQWENARIYNENLAGDPAHDPFVAGTGYVLPDNYADILNPAGDGVMCTLEIPKIGVELPVYHGTGEEALEKGAGHLENTALPIGGEDRHAVLCAHRGLPSAELFTRLDEMEEGDRFYLHVLDETHAYEVDQVEVILPEEVEKLVPEEGKDLVTLLTCTPYGVNTHRLLVRGSRIPYEEGMEEGERANTEKGLWKEAYVLAAAAGVAAVVVTGTAAVVIRGKRKRKQLGRRRK